MPVINMEQTGKQIAEFWSKAAVLIWKAISTDKKYHTFKKKKKNAWRLKN